MESSERPTKVRIFLVSRALWILEYIFFYRRWKKALLTSKVLQVNTPSTILDVGANVGQSISFFRQISSRSIIYAFEPHPDCFSTLMRKFQGSVHLFDYAISDSDKLVSFFISPMSETSSLSLPNFDSNWSKLKNRILGLTEEESYVEVQVQSRSLDSFLQEHNITLVDLVKIDVEGAEYSVLLGAKNSLSEGKIKAVQLEVHHDDLRETHEQEIQTFLINHNFRKSHSIRHSFGNFTEDLWILPPQI